MIAFSIIATENIFKQDKRIMRKQQMSETVFNMTFLALSGGMQDAYSYCVRGGVFANAQTGNIVLMSKAVFESDLQSALRYLIPILVFGCGIVAAEQISARFKECDVIHWRQFIIVIEIVLLLLVGFIPKGEGYDYTANALTSFSCAMQVQAFRKVNGYAYASTMCTGNFRSAMEALSEFLRTGDRNSVSRMQHYFVVIFFFALGAGVGSLLSRLWGIGTIWICCILLSISFCLMFKESVSIKNNSLLLKF